MTSSPATGRFFWRYLSCHFLSDAILAGVALMNAQSLRNAASAYISLALEAPVGVRFTRMSVLASFRRRERLDGLESLICILSPTTVDIPSSGWAIATFTPRGAGSENFLTLFGSAKIASDRSFPTLRLSTSNAATNLMSLATYPPTFGWLIPIAVLALSR